jgi:hypothetical protein
MVMSEALLMLAALGAIVWLAIFTAAKASIGPVAALKASAYHRALDRALDAEIAEAAANEEREPPLPTMSLREALEAEMVRQKLKRALAKRDAEGRLTTSSNASGARPTRERAHSS